MSEEDQPELMTPEDARAFARKTFAWFSEGANEQIGVGALDQYIGQWRNQFAQVGLDLTDRETLWTVAITADRLIYMLMTDAQQCPMASHIVHHIRSGATPMILVLNSAIATYGGPETE